MEIALLIVSVLIIILYLDKSEKAYTGGAGLFSRRAPYKNISPEAAKVILKENNGAVLLDVRRLEEYKLGHIRGAVLLPVDQLRETVEFIILDKKTVIFVFDRNQKRSIAACKILAELGYKKVYNLVEFKTGHID